MSTRDMLEKIFLAGVGALSITGEKAGNLLDELVARGALTVEQGKVLNEELKHSIKTTFTNPPAGTPADQSADQFEDQPVDRQELDILVLLRHVETLDEGALAQLKSKLAELEAKDGGAPSEA